MGKALGFRSWALAVIGGLAGAAPAAAEPSSSPDPFPVVNGTVSTILVDGTTAYIGGDFTGIGQPTGPMALVSKADGSIVRTFRGFASHFEQGSQQGVRVAAIEPDGVGGWYVGGEFARVDGRFRMSLVHLRADGTLDPAFSMDTDSSVGALKFDPQTNTLWVGGSFRYVNGVPRPSLVAVDATTGDPRPWLLRGARGGVGTFELDGDRIYVGGSLDGIGDHDQSAVIALSRDGGRVLDWDPRVWGDGSVGDIDVHDGIVYLTGNPLHIVGGVQLEQRVMAVRADDASVVPVEYSVTDGLAGDIVVTDDVVVVGHVEGTREGERGGLVAYDRESGAVLPWFADVVGFATGFAVSDGVLYMTGVRRVGAEERNGLAAFDLATGEVLPWAPGAEGSSSPTEVAVAGNTVAVAGGSLMLGGVERRDLAAVDLRTNQVLPFDARIQPWLECCGFNERGRVDGLAMAGGRLWVGGSFSQFSDQERPYLAQVDPVTGAVGPAPAEPSGKVFEVHASGGRVYFGGRFSWVDGQIRERVAAVDAVTGALDPFVHELDCEALAFAPLATSLLVGGCFDYGAEGLRSVDPATGGPGSVPVPEAVFGSVNAIAPDGAGGVWVGGGFYHLSDGSPGKLARLRADGSVDPRVPVFDDDDTVYSLAVNGPETYVGGDWGLIGGVPRGWATVLRPDGSVGRWDPQPQGPPHALAALPDGGVLMGGEFDSMELGHTVGLARFGPARTMPVPQLLWAPTVIGDRHVDGSQFISGGDFSGSPHRREIRWLRCDASGVACSDTGRRGRGIQLRSDDVGHRFRLEVVAVNDSSTSGTARSEPGPVVEGRLPSGVNPPPINGQLREGATLSVSGVGDWYNGATSFRYQWLRCPVGCTAIPGATGLSYTLTEADVNAKVTLQVWGRNAAGETALRFRDVGPILPAEGARAPVNLRRPAISGVLRNPTTLFADDGAWQNHPDRVYLSWERCSADGTDCVQKRNSKAYRITAGDAGYRFRVRVVGENEAGRSEDLYSELSPVIPATSPTPSPTPTPTPTPSPTPTPTPSPTPAPEPTPDPGSSVYAPPETEPGPQTTTTPPTTNASPPVVEAARPVAVRVISAHAGTGRRAVLRLRSGGALRATLELQRGRRTIATTFVDLPRAGTATVRVRLPRSAWQTLQRRGTLSTTVRIGETRQTIRLRR